MVHIYMLNLRDRIRNKNTLLTDIISMNFTMWRSLHVFRGNQASVKIKRTMIPHIYYFGIASCML